MHSFAVRFADFGEKNLHDATMSIDSGASLRKTRHIAGTFQHTIYIFLEGKAQNLLQALNEVKYLHVHNLSKERALLCSQMLIPP